MGNYSNVGKELGNRAVGAKKTTTKPQGDEWEQADGFINVGYPGERDPETGEEPFISFARGIPITQKLLIENPGKSAIMQAKGALGQAAHDLLATMEPGEERILTLEVRIRRREEQVQATGDSNPHIAALERLGFAV